MSVFFMLNSAVTGLEVTFAERTMPLPLERVKTVQLLTRETPDFITLALWLANSPVDLEEAAGACVPQPDS